MLFARNVSYICRKCGTELEFTPLFSTINKIVNFLFIGGLIFFAFSQSGTSDNSSQRLIMYLLIMTGLVVLYLLIQYLMISFGMYQEKPLPPADPAENKDITGGSTESQKTSYTKEQQEIIDLYAYYEKKNRDESEAASEEEAAPVIPEVLCENHVPVKTWRTYMPSNNSFVCANCGKPITFVKEQKRQLNMILMVFSILLMAGFFYLPNVTFWELVLMAVGVLLICTVIQYFFVKKGRFELRDEDQQR